VRYVARIFNLDEMSRLNERRVVTNGFYRFRPGNVSPAHGARSHTYRESYLCTAERERPSLSMYVCHPATNTKVMAGRQLAELNASAAFFVFRAIKDATLLRLDFSKVTARCLSCQDLKWFPLQLQLERVYGLDD